MQRHRYGNGKILDEAFACSDSYLSPSSLAQDEAEIYDSFIGDSHIHGKAHIIRSEIFYSDISGNVRIWGNAHLSRVTVRDFACIANARIVAPTTVKNIEINRRMWIDRGEWERPPRYAEIVGENVQVGLTECVEGRAHIGCMCLPIEEWTRPKYRQRIGKARGWTPEQIEFTFDLFSSWATNPV